MKRLVTLFFLSVAIPSFATITVSSLEHCPKSATITEAEYRVDYEGTPAIRVFLSNNGVFSCAIKLVDKSIPLGLKLLTQKGKKLVFGKSVSVYGDNINLLKIQ